MMFFGLCMPSACDKNDVDRFLHLISSNKISVANTTPEISRINHCQMKKDIHEEYTNVDFIVM